MKNNLLNSLCSINHSLTSPTQNIQFHSQDYVIIQFPPQDNPRWPQITCSSRLLINPFGKPSAHADNIPIQSNKFPTFWIIARHSKLLPITSMKKSFCQEVIFWVHADLGTFGALSQTLRIFSQEDRRDTKIGISQQSVKTMEWNWWSQLAISKGGDVKLDEDYGLFSFYVNSLILWGIEVPEIIHPQTRQMTSCIFTCP